MFLNLTHVKKLNLYASLFLTNEFLKDAFKCLILPLNECSANVLNVKVNSLFAQTGKMHLVSHFEFENLNFALLYSDLRVDRITCLDKLLSGTPRRTSSHS